ncbi:hypothetical protein, partial [Rhodoblastus sp.]|uniref:hypothetical protein n=1 Tax=Rhodoblastus sp. TaxID=1962975 RepID=UPI003F9E20DA
MPSTLGAFRFPPNWDIAGGHVSGAKPPDLTTIIELWALIGQSRQNDASAKRLPLANFFAPGPRIPRRNLAPSVDD